MLIWKWIGLTAAFFTVLACIALRMREGSAFHRGLQKCVCACLALFLCSLVPGMQAGVNTLAVAVVAALGLPGLGLLQVIALMP